MPPTLAPPGDVQVLPSLVGRCSARGGAAPRRRWHILAHGAQPSAANADPARRGRCASSAGGRELWGGTARGLVRSSRSVALARLGADAAWRAALVRRDVLSSRRGRDPIARARPLATRRRLERAPRQGLEHLPALPTSLIGTRTGNRLEWEQRGGEQARCFDLELARGLIWWSQHRMHNATTRGGSEPDGSRLHEDAARELQPEELLPARAAGRPEAQSSLPCCCASLNLRT